MGRGDENLTQPMGSLDWLEANGPQRASVQARKDALDAELANRWLGPGAKTAPGAGAGAVAGGGAGAGLPTGDVDLANYGRPGGTVNGAVFDMGQRGTRGMFDGAFPPAGGTKVGGVPGSFDLVNYGMPAAGTGVRRGTNNPNAVRTGGGAAAPGLLDLDLDGYGPASGGPMRYGVKGEKTNNPNAYPVGPRTSRAQRVVNRAVRSGDERAALSVLGMDEAERRDAEQRDFQREMAGRSEDFDLRRYGTQRDFQREMTGRSEGFDLYRYGLQREDEERRYERGRMDELADKERDAVVGGDLLEYGNGFVPMVRTRGGEMRPAGGFYPNAKTDYVPTAEELEAWGLVPDQVKVNGVVMKRPAEAKPARGVVGELPADPMKPGSKGVPILVNTETGTYKELKPEGEAEKGDGKKEAPKGKSRFFKEEEAKK